MFLQMNSNNNALINKAGNTRDNSVFFTKNNEFPSKLVLIIII